MCSIYCIMRTLTGFNVNFREDRRKKEVEDLISKYAKKKDKDEVMTYLVQL